MDEAEESIGTHDLPPSGASGLGNVDAVDGSAGSQQKNRPKAALSPAQLFWISPHTVRKHFESAYISLGVRTRTAAIAAAWPEGLAEFE